LRHGHTGFDWLRLLNEDDGNTEWQSQDWNAINNKFATQMEDCSNDGQYVTEVAYGPRGAWYMHGIRWVASCENVHRSSMAMISWRVLTCQGNFCCHDLTSVAAAAAAKGV